MSNAMDIELIISFYLYKNVLTEWAMIESQCNPFILRCATYIWFLRNFTTQQQN